MLGRRPRRQRWRRGLLLPLRRGAVAGSDVPRPRRDSNASVNGHAGLGQAYPPTGLDRGDLDDDLAEWDGAENVDREASDPQWPLNRLVDHMGKKGSRRSTVLGVAVPWALSGPGRLVSSVPTGQVIGLGVRRHDLAGSSMGGHGGRGGTDLSFADEIASNPAVIGGVFRVRAHDGKPVPCWPAWLTAEGDVNRPDPALNRRRERTDPAQRFENVKVVAEDIGVHGGHTLGPSAVEQGHS
jgi:hypothetical protein